MLLFSTTKNIQVFRSLRPYPINLSSAIVRGEPVDSRWSVQPTRIWRLPLREDTEGSRSAVNAKLAAQNAHAPIYKDEGCVKDRLVLSGVFVTACWPELG